MVVCGGFAQAIGLVCATLVRSGRTRIAVEDPGHATIRAAVERSGMTTVPVPVDGDGLDVDTLARSASEAALLTPAHQFPTGVVLSPERRGALVDWARERDAFLIEDDYDAEFRYDRAPVGAIQGLAPDRVFYLGSASKTLAPTLRIGWIVPPREFTWPLVEEVLYTVFATPHLEQLAFADFIGRGELDRHLRRMRLVYRRRRDTLVRALERALPELEIGGIAAGLHVIASLPAGIDERRVLDAAFERRISVSGLGEHCAAARSHGALLIGYAATSEAGIRAGVRELASAFANA
jgi:GntR family transcriptional regulator/MocR family aminotransferase